MFDASLIQVVDQQDTKGSIGDHLPCTLSTVANARTGFGIVTIGLVVMLAAGARCLGPPLCVAAFWPHTNETQGRRRD
jgi:hypothetical protein